MAPTPVASRTHPTPSNHHGHRSRHDARILPSRTLLQVAFLAFALPLTLLLPAERARADPSGIYTGLGSEDDLGRGDAAGSRDRTPPPTSGAIIIGNSRGDAPRGRAGRGRPGPTARSEQARKLRRRADERRRSRKSHRALDRSLDILRRQTHEAEQCHQYFDDQGVDLASWLDEDLPPYIYPLEPASDLDPNVCGWAQGGEPFNYLFINVECVEKIRTTQEHCHLASLVLHEMGHLARRDVGDHEPPEFFNACRVGCLDPGRFR